MFSCVNYDRGCRGRPNLPHSLCDTCLLLNLTPHTNTKPCASTAGLAILYSTVSGAMSSSPSTSASSSASSSFNVDSTPSVVVKSSNTTDSQKSSSSPHPHKPTVIGATTASTNPTPANSATAATTSSPR